MLISLLTGLTSCTPHPTRHLIINLKEGTAKVDSEYLVIKRLGLFEYDQIPIDLYDFNLSEASSNLRFTPMTESRFKSTARELWVGDSSFTAKKVFIKCWAIDTLREQEYYFQYNYEKWGDIKQDTLMNFDDVGAPKYSDSLRVWYGE